MADRKRALVFANGLITNDDSVRELLANGDLIIAADGGAMHCARLGIKPDYLIGDFDSLPDPDLDQFIEQGVVMIHHPARKDYTDLELALLHARSLGVEDILVFGGLGARWDQTLANLLLPASIGLMDTKIHLVDDRQVLTMLHGSENHTILGEPGDVVSLIPISGDTHGVTTQGLEYPLDAETLHFGATRGISNTLTGRRASVSLQQGALLCVVIHLDQKA